LDLDLNVDDSGHISTIIYDKRDGWRLRKSE
jgi:hypothetical protein